MRVIARLGVLYLFLVPVYCSLAQSPTGTVSGRVLDPDGRAIAGAGVLVVNDLTGLQFATKSDEEGIYLITNLPPGPYRLQVSKVGFKALLKPDIILNVQDALSINFRLPIGAASIVVTVEGGASNVNTTDGSVSTVVDRKFVENIPLNGRSFQNLILLTPGIVTTSPQTTAHNGGSGEFSVNGQRTESNYYTVDGVSSNVGVSPSFVNTPAASGSLPASTALGTTQGLVSVDALEEFRVQTSTYSAEYGRSPGGQFSFVTRSGTNQWHGTAFDYVRNDVFDANDWFNNYNNLIKPALRQNDFGGTFGGPVVIPHVYNGRGKTFFFSSYEGLRVLQPQEASVAQVPTLLLRQSAPSALQAVLNAFPLPHCPRGAANCVVDLGNGLGDFIGSWSNPSSLNSYSLRLDEVVHDRLRLFFHFSDTASRLESRLTSEPSLNSITSFGTRTYTAGATSSFSSRVSNDFRLNYSSNAARISARLDDFAGASGANLFALQGLGASSVNSAVILTLLFGPYSAQIDEQSSQGQQRQWNLVDNVNVSLGRHQFKIGADYRRLTPRIFPISPLAFYGYFSESSVQANAADIVVANTQSFAFPIYTNFSAFLQDNWHVVPRLNVAFGLRWEVNPAPGAADGNLPYTVTGNSLATLTLAPQGTPLWRTDWVNIAPRLGAAYTLRNTPGWETVLRGGAGVFFDTAQQTGSYGYIGPGFSGSAFFAGGATSTAFPLPVSQVTPSITNPPTLPTSTTVYAYPTGLQLPFTLQWNASAEQALGPSQALTVSYVGAKGRRLLEENTINVAALNNPNLSTVIFFENGLTSDYNALQAQFQRKLSRGLQVLASYTWAHSIDYGSFNTAQPYRRGNSDLDVRHSFSTAVTYNFRNDFGNKYLRAAVGHWGFDDWFTARTGFPVTLNGNPVFDPATNKTYNGGLSLVAGQPSYVYGSQCATLFGSPCPGGRAINPQAFTNPPEGQLGDAPRNFLRGFGAWEMDVAVRREFPIHENLRLQFRAEAFNVFNHPNFGAINAQFGQSTFGQATGTLATSLGVLSPLYQIGGPRSLQLALKLIFN